MIVSINQPAYLPWYGYFDRIARSDLHIVLDDVQYSKNELTNRNRMRAPGGGWTWMTVPVKKGSAPINEMQIDHSRNWGRKQYRTMEQAYGKYEGFLEYGPWWQAYLQHIEGLRWLWQVLDETRDWFLETLEIVTPIIRSSSLHVGNKYGSDLVLALCRDVGATKYLSGPHGRNYLVEQDFEDAYIALEYADWHPPETQVINELGVKTPLSALDALFMYGKEEFDVAR